MSKLLTYHNIWARNVVIASFMFVFIYYQNKYTPEFNGFKKPDEIEFTFIFIVLYALIFTYNHFIVRLLLLKKRYWRHLMATLGFLFLTINFNIFIDRKIGLILPLFAEVTASIFHQIILTGVYLGHTWFLQNVVDTKLQLLNKDAELNFLKQQLSPHFLFNAINNLYGTALASPHIVPDKILELSDLLRYQIEATTKDKVTTKQEMDFVADYISYTNYKTNNLEVKNEVVGKVQNFELPPLLFLPLIENAIKYSAESENPRIGILWKFEDNGLCFSIENTCSMDESKTNSTKVGLDNLNKRLQLMSIKHKLTIDQTTLNTYKINLKLWGMPSNA
jgi:two-component system, LytTR family, sensor kinase